MAFEYKNVLPENKTGFTFKGREIVLSKTRGRPLSGKYRQGYYTDKKRIEAVTIYAVTGNLTEVEKLTGIPSTTVSSWRKEEWFQHLLDEIRQENDEKIDSKFTQIVETVLDEMVDRVKNGDFVVTKYGQVVRKPIGARDLAIVAAINIDKRQLLRGKPTSRTESVGVDVRLAQLAKQFEQIANHNRQPLEITDVTYTEIPQNASEVGKGIEIPSQEETPVRKEG